MPEPVPLSRHRAALERIERSRWYTNFGPVSRSLESAFVEKLFDGSGACTSVANATLGLLLAIRARRLEAFGERGLRDRDLAILPAFTFPATAQAAVWNGLTPAFCDVHPDTWLADEGSILRLIEAHPGRIGVIVPYATFGNNLDLSWYEALESRTGIPVVVDAAASIGSRLGDGSHFGRGSALPTVFSMHATKILAGSEGGMVYCGRREIVDHVRAMSNFGFDGERLVTLPGINAKLSEIGALQALLKLRSLGPLVRRRALLARRYRRGLPRLRFQVPSGEPAIPFLAAAVDGTARERDRVIARAAERGIEIRKYYHPPLHRHPLWAKVEDREVPVTDALASRILTLPLYDSLTPDSIDRIIAVVGETLG